jgi:hypothetical protein
MDACPECLKMKAELAEATSLLEATLVKAGTNEAFDKLQCNLKCDAIRAQAEQLSRALEFYTIGWHEVEISDDSFTGKTWRPSFSRRNDHGMKALEALASYAAFKARGGAE